MRVDKGRRDASYSPLQRNDRLMTVGNAFPPISSNEEPPAAFAGTRLDCYTAMQPKQRSPTAQALAAAAKL